MGCNCGSKASGQAWLYTAPSGQQTKYKTEIEAKAAQIRNGGGQITVVSA